MVGGFFFWISLKLLGSFSVNLSSMSSQITDSAAYLSSSNSDSDYTSLQYRVLKSLLYLTGVSFRRYGSGRKQSNNEKWIRIGFAILYMSIGKLNSITVHTLFIYLSWLRHCSLLGPFKTSEIDT